MKNLIAFLALFGMVSMAEAVEYRVKWGVVVRSSSPYMDEYGQIVNPHYQRGVVFYHEKTFDKGMGAAIFLEGLGVECPECNVTEFEAICPKCEPCDESHGKINLTPKPIIQYQYYNGVQGGR